MEIETILLFAQSFCEIILLLVILRMVNPTITLGIFRSLIFAAIIAIIILVVDHYQIPFHMVISIATTIVFFLLLKRPSQKLIGPYVIDILLSTVILTLLQFIITFVASLFSMDLLNQPIATICILCALAFIVYKLSSSVRVCAFFEKYYIQHRSTVIFSIISILFFMVIIANLSYYHVELLNIAGSGQVYLIGIGYFAINIWLIINLYRLNRAYKEKAAVIEYGEHLQNKVDDYRMSIHDFKHYMQAIIYLNRDDDGLVKNEELDMFLKSLIHENNQKNESSIIMDDVVISAMLHQKRDLAKQKGIDFIVNPVDRLLAFGIPQNELIGILNNLIDNAFEAIEDMEPDVRTVWLDFTENFIEVKNRATFIKNGSTSLDTNRFFEKGYSTKGSNRGYGLSNVLLIADRYGIKIQHGFKNGLVFFRLDFPGIPLRVPEDEKSSGS